MSRPDNAADGHRSLRQICKRGSVGTPPADAPSTWVDAEIGSRRAQAGSEDDLSDYYLNQLHELAGPLWPLGHVPARHERRGAQGFRATASQSIGKLSLAVGAVSDRPLPHCPEAIHPAVSRRLSGLRLTGQTTRPPARAFLPALSRGLSGSQDAPGPLRAVPRPDAS
jgi:hypothetical protein